MPKHQVQCIKTLTKLAVVCCFLSIAGPLWGQVNSNRTLFGNKAVQDDLQLTDAHRIQINEILAVMEDEIAAQRKSAGQNAEDADKTPKASATVPIVEKHCNRAMEVLDNEQKNRFWQIGAQSAGVGVFQNNRTQRVLRLSKDQLQTMETIRKEGAQAFRKAALNPDLTKSELRALAEREQKKQYDEFLNLLTDDQRKAFDELLGKPFDLELLKNPEGKKPRSLTFVFDLTWRNAHSLLSSPEIKKSAGITLEQQKQLTPLFTRSDLQVTAVRLGILKGLDVDFSQLDDAAKTEVALKICDEVRPIFREAEKHVSEILTSDQAAELDRQLIRLIGIRAIGSDRIATELELTADQKRAFAEAESEFERNTAPLRVVRSPREFDTKTESQFKASFETKAKSLLTTKQLEKLESHKKD